MTTRIPIQLPRSASRFVTPSGEVISISRAIRRPKRPASSAQGQTSSLSGSTTQPFQPPVLTQSPSKPHAAAPAATMAPAVPVAPPAPAGLSREDGQQLMTIIRALTSEIEGIQSSQQAVFDDVYQLAVELALEAAACVIGQAVAADQFRVDLLVQQALHRIDAEGAVRIRLHPQDHALLKKLSETESSTEFLGTVTYVDDPGLPRGTIRVDSAKRTMISDLHTRLEEIRREWMENLDAAST